jgi:membrane-associated phospholipid phosphatase
MITELEAPAQPRLDYSTATPPTPRRWRGVMLRFGAVVLGLAAWFSSQAALAKVPPPVGVVGDGIHRVTAGVNQYLLAHPSAANGLLIASSLGIDALGLFLLGSSIFGRSIRPFLGLLVLFALRQICQVLCTLPIPDGMIWRDPGFPSLLVTYGTSNDLFFSGHTAMAVFGAIMLARTPTRHRTLLTGIAVVIALFEVTVVLVLKAHYTMDVFTGAVTAIAVARGLDRLSPPVDRLISRLAGAAAPPDTEPL